jgi:penicillin-binding protein 1C
MKRRRIALLACVCIAAAGAYLLRPYPLERLSPDRDAPLVVTDRNGEVLRKLASASGRREAWLPLGEVPGLFVLAVMASEDNGFFEHAGVDPRGLERAAWLDVKARRFTYGGSTLSMQLARLLDPALSRKTLFAKLSQSIVALRLERTLTKREIIEQYVNRAGFGNGTVGVEAAAQTYFGKPAHALGPGEATLLAVLPRAPTQYDPLRHLEEALRRRAHVLEQLEARGLVSAAERRLIETEPVAPVMHAAPNLAPHFVDFAIAQLPANVRADGGVLRTTLDLPLQQRLEHRLRDHVAALDGEGLHQAGALILDTASGEVVALVGSADYDGEAGQLDIVDVRRHPGSALKPFVYATAIEQGASPASIAVDAGDVPSDYLVRHPSSSDRGPLRYREALAGSYNLSAVHVLEEVGIDRVLTKLRAAGLGALDAGPREYGLRLALGSASVRLVDLASAYGFLVRGGKVVPARAILEVDHARDAWRPTVAGERQVFSEASSWLVMDMLADPDARRFRFGDELPLDLPFRVAAKTGTSRGFADTVAVGVTREWTVAAWGGNFDGKATQGLRAMQSAAPLVRAGLLLAGNGRALSLPKAPRGIVRREVCALSGLTPGAHCARHKLEHFRADLGAPPPCTWHDGAETRLPALYAGWQSRTARP